MPIVRFTFVVLVALTACKSQPLTTHGCQEDKDCGDPASAFRCETQTGECFCRTDDACQPREFCNPAGFCQDRAGCETNADCADSSLFCDTTTGTCLGKGRCSGDLQCNLGQIFDLGLYAPGTSRTVTFRHAGIVRVFCNIHPSMSAVIVVLNGSWFAVSDAAGAFSIPNVSAGDYQMRVFYERAAQNVLAALTRRVTAGAADLALPSFTVSETGYVEAPHKNKYGQDYPPVPDDRAPYPAPRK